MQILKRPSKFRNDDQTPYFYVWQGEPLCKIEQANVNLFIPQSHYMHCPRCDKRFSSSQASKASLRAKVARHIAEVHEVWGKFDLCKIAFDQNVAVDCPTCHRVFDHSNSKRANQNSLEEHMQVKLSEVKVGIPDPILPFQVHKPRSHSCPVCGEQRFRSQTNAVQVFCIYNSICICLVQHVESGACSRCPGGREGARKAIHGFVASHRVRGMERVLVFNFSK